MPSDNPQMTPCAYCGVLHQSKCPTVKAYEYHPDGTIKRVEFYSQIDFRPLTASDLMMIREQQKHNDSNHRHYQHKLGTICQDC